MPIVEKTLPGAARAFCDRLNSLLAATLTESRLVVFEARGAFCLGFRRRGVIVEAPLSTQRGRFGLSIGQTFEGVSEPGGIRLTTRSYRYVLTPEGAQEGLFRWEYEKRWPRPEDRWCRHHLQGTVSVPLPLGSVALDALHVPTGYVTLEEVLRFCIVDLGAKPRKKGWHERLEESYRRFREDEE